MEAHFLERGSKYGTTAPKIATTYNPFSPYRAGIDREGPGMGVILSI